MSPRWAGVWRWFPPVVAFAVSLTLLGIYCYPGFMSYDSAEQLAQARSGHYTDWHPPILPLIWKPLDALVAGPLLFVLLQSSLLLGGLYVLFARAMRAWYAALATIVVFCFPPVITVMAVVWKDALMAGVMVAAFAALTSSRRWVQYASVIGWLVATMLRHNAAIAVIPMLTLLVPWFPARPRWQQRVVGFGIALAIAATAQLCNRALTDEQTHPFHNSVAVIDIAGTLRYAPPLADAEVERLLAGVPLVAHAGLQAHARRVYTPLGWWAIVRDAGRLMDPPATDAQRDAVVAAWLRLIRTYPGAYLHARYRMFGMHLGFTKQRLWHVFNATSEDPVLLSNQAVTPSRSAWQHRLSRWVVELSQDSLLFRPYLYLACALALVIVRRRRVQELALLLGAFAYEATLFVLAPSMDFRYAHWLILCTLISLALHLATSVAREPAAQPAR